MNFLVRVLLGLLSVQEAQSQSQPGSAIPSVPWYLGPKLYSLKIPEHGKPVPAAAGHGQLSLFSGRNAVSIVSAESLKAKLASTVDNDAQKWHIVEFYDRTCPHCWYSVPVVTDLAEAFAGVPNLEINSMNCHEMDNMADCNVLAILTGSFAYPSFALCPPLAFQRGHQSEEEIIKSLPERVKTQLGDMSDTMKKSLMQFARCEASFQDTKKVADHGYIPLNADSLALWITRQTSLKPTAPDMIHRGADVTDDHIMNPRESPGALGWLMDKRVSHMGIAENVAPQARWEDATGGLIALLYHNYVPMEHDAVLEVISFIAKAFPARHIELNDLKLKLAEMGKQHDPMALPKFLDQWIVQHHLGVNPKEEKYQTCRGNSCALWTLLHATVGSISARGITGKPLRTDEQSKVQPIGTAEARSFVSQCVKAFLICGPCRAKFLSDYQECRYGSCKIGDQDWHGLSLWLWRTHNAVSLQVAIEHRGQEDRRWPMDIDCPSCWKSSAVLGKNGRSLSSISPDQWTIADLDAPFHLEHIFWFLMQTFVGIDNMQLDLKTLNEKERAMIKAHNEAFSAKAVARFHSSVGKSAQQDAPQGVQRLASALVAVGVLGSCFWVFLLQRGYTREFFQFQQRQGCLDQRAFFASVPEHTLDDQAGSDEEMFPRGHEAGEVRVDDMACE